MEIERKYLVASVPAHLDSFSHIEIEQGYLCTSPTLRIRRMGDAYILTVKEHISSDSTAIHNREEEFSLDEDAYLSLKAKCEGRFLSKTRYKIPLPPDSVSQTSQSSGGGEYGLVAELDVFHGRLEGLRVVEVEFPDTLVADAFIPPDWFGDEVSQDPRFRNINLVSYSLQDVLLSHNH